MNYDKKIKLGQRLQQIESMVTAPYDHIWDCCCDHGLLGAALLSRHAAAHIHFVDVVPELIHKLESKLRRFFSLDAQPNPVSQWHLHCMNLTTLPLGSGGKHLIIIAGVGGDLMVDFIEGICQHNPTSDIHFLLCPVHHQFALRQQLIKYHFCLQTEALIAENKRYYEVLLVSKSEPSLSSRTAAITSVGSLLWHSNTPEQAIIASAYLQKTLAHYKRMQLNPQVDVQHIIDAYSAVAIGIPHKK